MVLDEYGISAATRYFQHKGETQPHDVIPLDDNVDPNRMLATAADDEYLHTVNNRVEYYERVDLGSGVHR